MSIRPQGLGWLAERPIQGWWTVVPKELDLNRGDAPVQGLTELHVHSQSKYSLKQ